MTQAARRIMGSGAISALLVVGCGGGGNGAAAPTKSEFIKSADAICLKADGAQKKAQIAFQKKYPAADSSRRWEEKIVVAAGLPPVRVAAEELSDLTAPSGDEGEIRAIVDAIENAVEKSETQPGSLLQKGSAGAFAPAVRLAREYGFKACANPL